MHTMPNVQNMQNSLLLTERTSALWAVYGYFYHSTQPYSIPCRHICHCQRSGSRTKSASSFWRGAISTSDGIFVFLRRQLTSPTGSCFFPTIPPNAPMLTNYNEEEKARCYNSTTHDPIERCPRHVTHLRRRLRSRWRELLVISPRSQFLRITWFGLWTQCKHYTVFADMMQRARCKTQRKNYEGAKRSYSARTQYWTIFGSHLKSHSIINVSVRVLIVKTARNKRNFHKPLFIETITAKVMKYNKL